MKLAIGLLTLVVGIFLTIAMLFSSGWERPPIESVQRGFRGTGMVELFYPPALIKQAAANQLPDVSPPIEAPPGSPLARDVYKNVPVLGHLDAANFTRLMVAMTSWVAPTEGCNYCHEGGDLASDKLYTKVVSRRMLQMTQHINADWKTHVGATGVTCFTCHRGNPVPANVWFSDPAGVQARGSAGWNFGQNAPARTVAMSSLPGDPFTPFLVGNGEIRVVSDTALPVPGKGTGSTQHTEWTYGLMMHFSDSLGVNCTYCHNSRSFKSWDGSTPQRANAWYGIRMVRDINNAYLDPLKGTYPPNRLGPHSGDAPKANCATCHQGAFKPLLGASMLSAYPELASLSPAPPVVVPTPAPVVTAEMVILFFAVDSAALHNDAPTALGMIAAKLKINPKAKATISGYHSATGDQALNHELAKNRAMAVQGALKLVGIEETRVILVKPVAEQANVAGEDANARRVEVTVK